MEFGGLLFYGGIAAMAAAAVGAVVAAVLLHMAKKRLKHRLDEEFGEEE